MLLTQHFGQVHGQGSVYPPVSLTAGTITTAGTISVINSWTSTVSGAPYGNGVYKTTTSSVAFTNGAPDPPFWKLFMYPLDGTGGHWDANMVGGGLNSALQTNSRFTLDGTNYGEWVHVQLPYKILMTRCLFVTRSGLAGRAPTIFKIYGSNDGVNWVVIHSQTSAITYNGNRATFLAQAQTAYSYFALLVIQIGNSEAWVNLANWQIYGLEQVLMSYVHACITIIQSVALHGGSPSWRLHWRC
jgi:hypothetical protein